MSLCPYWYGDDNPPKCTKDCETFQCKFVEAIAAVLAKPSKEITTPTELQIAIVKIK